MKNIKYVTMQAGLLGFFISAIALTGLADTHYVDINNPSPVPPYTNGWASAANSIQDAIDDAATIAGDLVLVSNGVYNAGGRTNASTGNLTNRVVIDKSITVQAVSTNPADTVIAGAADARSYGLGTNAIRCVVMAVQPATLSGFTLTNGHAFARYDGAGQADTYDKFGGAIWCVGNNDVVTNCIIRNNTAWGNAGAYRGSLRNCTVSSNAGPLTGAWGGTAVGEAALYQCTISYNPGPQTWATLFSCNPVYNCLIKGNTARYHGGAYDSKLYNCTVVSNYAYDGAWDATAGGIGTGSATNCIVYYNTFGAGGFGSNNYNTVTPGYTCTTPDPGGTGNITNAPGFVNLAGGDFHLAAGSPCIDKGLNLLSLYNVDIEGNVRPRHRFFDMGAYEAPPPSGTIVYIY